MSKKIKYGVVGAGHLGQFHVQQALKFSFVEFVGVYDVLFLKAVDLSNKFGVLVFNELLSLLKECDAISICTPASYHYNVAIKALQNDCHLFIEKPFVSKLKDATSLINLNKKYNKKIQIGHIERFNPAFIEFMIYKPKPVFIESHRLAVFGERGLDVAVVLDLMIHDIELILFFVGSPISKISSSGASLVSNFIDLANARIEFKNGCVANLTASRISNKQMRKMRVFEKKAYSVLDFQQQNLNRWTIKNKKNIELKKTPQKTTNALYEELKCFFDCIINNKRVVVSTKHATSALKTALKIQRTIEKKI